MEPVDGLEGEETDNGGAEEGAGRLREAELQDHDVAQQDCDDAADRDDRQQAPRVLKMMEKPIEEMAAAMACEK